MILRTAALLSLTLSALAPAKSFAASDLQQGVEDLTQQIAEVMKSQGKTTIAVVEFVDLNGNVNQFGQLLAEKLITRLFTHSPGDFRIIERRQLMRVIAEQKLSISGLIDKGSIGKIASTLGVDALVTGSVSPFGNAVEINARCISVESAMVFAAAATTVPNTDDVAQLMAKPGLYSDIVDAQEAPGSQHQAATEDVDVKTQEGFEITFFGCSRSGRETACLFDLLNTQQDRKFLFSGYYHGSRMVGPGGVEYSPERVEIGNKRHQSYINHYFFSGVPTRAKMVFSGLPEDLASVPVFVVQVSGGALQYRNVPIRSR